MRFVLHELVDSDKTLIFADDFLITGRSVHSQVGQSFRANGAEDLFSGVRIWESVGNYWEQDWPVARELVAGGMHFHFCLQRARYDHPIRQKVPWENQWKKLRVVGFRNNRVEVK